MNLFMPAPMVATENDPVVTLVHQTRASAIGADGALFNSVSFGDPHPNRTILVSAVIFDTGTNAKTWASGAVKIDGSAATALVDNAIDSSDQVVCAIMARALPFGSSGTVLVGASGGNIEEIDIAVYRALYVDSLTPVDTGADSSSSGLTANLDLNTGANGFLLAVAGHHASTSYTWSGATETRDHDVNATTAGHAFVAQTAPGATPLTVDAVAAESNIFAGCSVSLAFA